MFEKKPKWKLVKKTITWPDREPHVEYHLMSDMGWPADYQIMHVFEHRADGEKLLEEMRRLDRTNVTYEDVA